MRIFFQLILFLFTFSVCYQCNSFNMYVTLIPPINQNIGYDILVVWISDVNCTDKLYFRNLETNVNGSIPSSFDYSYQGTENTTFYVKKALIHNKSDLEPISEISIGEEQDSYSESKIIKIPNEKSTYEFFILSNNSNSNFSNSIIKLIENKVRNVKENHIPIIIDFGNQSIDNLLYYNSIKVILSNTYYIHQNQNISCCHYENINHFPNGIMHLPDLTISIFDPMQNFEKQIYFMNNSLYNFNQTFSILIGGREFLITSDNELSKVEDFLKSTKTDLYVSGNLAVNYFIRDNIMNISYINIGVSGDQIISMEDIQTYQNIVLVSKRFDNFYSLKASYGWIEKPPGLKAQLQLTTFQNVIVQSVEIKSNHFVPKNSLNFEEITAIIVFIITLSFFSYFVYSWIMCTRSRQPEERELKNLNIESKSNTIGESKEKGTNGEIKMQIK